MDGNELLNNGYLEKAQMCWSRHKCGGLRNKCGALTVESSYNPASLQLFMYFRKQIYYFYFY
jgi:hypothetical protein